MAFSSAWSWCTPPHLIHFPTSPHLSASILSPLTDTLQFVCFSACIHLESCTEARAGDVTQNDALLKRALSTSLILMHAIMLIRLRWGKKKKKVSEFSACQSFPAPSFLWNRSKSVNSKYISKLWHTPSTCSPIRPAASVMVHRSTIITISSGVE